MLALSIKQPWAWLILHAGKDVENRSWAPPMRAILGNKGRIYIHAGKSYDTGIDELTAASLPLNDEQIDRMLKESHQPASLGAIIGEVTLYGYRAPEIACVSPWTVPGQHHWLLCDPKPYDKPILCRGRLGLWVPPEMAQS